MLNLYKYSHQDTNNILQKYEREFKFRFQHYNSHKVLYFH